MIQSETAPPLKELRDNSADSKLLTTERKCGGKQRKNEEDAANVGEICNLAWRRGGAEV